MVSLIWAGFILFVLVLLILDLAVIHRKAEAMSAGKALRWTAVFVTLALLFNIVVYFLYENHALGLGQEDGVSVLTGKEAALQYFTGWLLEYSLSVDNVFVIALIFRHFAVPREYQHRVLFWGILGALVMRGIMIAVGAALIHNFHWMIYVFGGLLLLTAIRLFFTGDKEPEPETGLIFRTARRLLPVAPPQEGQQFFVRHAGKLLVTPLFLVLLVVEGTDVIFAVDSIPAIFGVTEDPFLVFTSNVFAILGLRSLYFALSAIIDKFRYLKTSLVFVLAFVGLKMLIPDHALKIDTEVSLGVIGGILALGVAASLLATRKERLRRQAPVDDLTEAAEEAWKRSRRIVICVIGFTVLALSIPVGLLPGPGGIAVAIGGLALLATEFVWARNLLKQMKRRSQQVAYGLFGGKPPKPWLVLPVAAGALALLLVLLYLEPFESHLILYASVGPALAIAFWAGWSLYRWRALKAHEEGREPPPPGPIA